MLRRVDAYGVEAKKWHWNNGLYLCAAGHAIAIALCGRAPRLPEPLTRGAGRNTQSIIAKGIPDRGLRGWRRRYCGPATLRT